MCTRRDFAKDGGGGGVQGSFSDPKVSSVFGSGACPFVVTRTALSWSGDKNEGFKFLVINE